jgi:hypothetical protein
MIACRQGALSNTCAALGVRIPSLVRSARHDNTEFLQRSLLSRFLTMLAMAVDVSGAVAGEVTQIANSAAVPK